MFLFILVILILSLYPQNNYIVTDKINYSSEKVPQSFDGFVITHISDLHGKNFGINNRILIEKIKKTKPDIIVITGDFIDFGFYNEKNMDYLIKKITNIASTYFVTGNQEQSNPNFTSLEKLLKKSGVKVLRNSTERIQKNGQYIRIAGIDDPIYVTLEESSFNQKSVTEKLKATLGNSESAFTILLAHRPEHFALYSSFNADLIFAGHAHGGQIRLPILGGIFSPDQGFFPKYSSGKYINNHSTLIVSRGLGNGTIPQRLFNLPEIITTTLYKK